MASAGLNYDQAFLNALPTTADIFTLTAEQFDNLHHSHVLSHPPDSVLFPFLHGLEGDNEVQNVFFASEGQQCTGRSDGKPTTAKVPRYRALTWVICEEDLESPEKDLKVIVHRRSVSSYSGDSESYDAEEEECDDDESSSESDPLSEQTSLSASYVTDPRVKSSDDLSMEVDIAYNDSGDSPIHLQSRQVIEIVGVGADDKHMHPVHHRPYPNDAHIPTSGYSSTEESSDTDEIQVASSDYDQSHSHLRDVSDSSEVYSTPSTPPKSSLQSQRSSPRIRQSPPPILTSTFRASELLRRVPGSASGNKQAPVGSAINLVNHKATSISTSFDGDYNSSRQQVANNTALISLDSTDDDGEWEFVPLRVPEGISLRNFGIQAPILATLSDIIVYSPTVNGAARSPHAVRLARRFKQALEKKRHERVTQLYNAKEMARNERKNDYVDDRVLPPITVDQSELPLNYNVFLLDATADDIRRELAHLVVRPCAEGEVPGSLGVSMNGGGSISRDQDNAVMSDLDEKSPGHENVRTVHARDCHVDLPPNTVNFAQREKDEMRDLTRASEIISVFPEGHPLYPDGSASSSSSSTSIGTMSGLAFGVGLSGSDESITLDEDDEVDIGNTKKFWDPMVGQVFLGNASDVPLPFEDGTEWELEYDTLVGGNSPASSARDVYAGIDFGKMLRKKGSDDGQEKHEQRGKVNVDKSNVEVTYMRPGGNAPTDGYGYDICIECHDQAPFPSLAHLKAAEQKVALLEATWKQRVENEREKLVNLRTKGNDAIGDLTDILPPRPAPHPNSVIHLPMPGSPPASASSINALMPVIRFLQMCLGQPEPVKMRVTDPVSVVEDPKYHDHHGHANNGHGNSETPKGRRWSSVSSLMSSFPSFPLTSQPTSPPSNPGPSSSSSRQRSFTSPVPPPSISRHRSSSPNSLQPRRWSRPLKVLVYSSDGYTESSLTALCLLMAFKSLDLPHAYLELQVNKHRSFFVYQMDLGLLRRVEEYMLEERKKEKERKDQEERERREREREWEGRYSFMNGSGHLAYSGLFNGGKGGYGLGTHINPYSTSGRVSSSTVYTEDDRRSHRSQVSKSVSFAHPPYEDMDRGVARAATMPMSSSLPSLQSSVLDNSMGTKRVQRPRARTSPWLPSLYGGDHQNWFNDPRFDGSFPSRVLPFLYLGNLNHASNVYMLQALGITHVVSVGECALIPPSNNLQSGGRPFGCNNGTSSRHFISGKSPNHPGSLWIEEQAGRIKVLDIQGVCDDGIDTLEPQLEPICDWIDEARQEGGQVLVHCRVGVSRSATVTIAYVMKHLSLPLVDAYLIVRSRRLSVLIQPNVRLLYNLLGWEIKLAKERAGGNERKLRQELSSTLTWPYLAKEVHALNEKYLH